MTRKPVRLQANGASATPVDPNGAVIVVGIDGSPSSWDAFDWAVGEAIRLPAHLIAVHVQPSVESLVAIEAPFGLSASMEAADQVAEQLHQDVQDRVHSLGVKVTFIRESGDTVAVLSRVAQSLKADLIVVGKSAKRVHHLAGSVGRRLIFSQDPPAIVVVP